MNVEVIFTVWGGFIAHEESCPWVETDWNNHGQTQYTMKASSVNEIAQEMQRQVRHNQTLGTVTKQISCHWCMSKTSVFPGSGFKVS
jgi:hypothetical protein